MPNAHPTLRPDIDAAPAERDGETFYILYDRAGVTGARLLVSPLGLLIAGRMDGSASILEITDILNGELTEPVACRDVQQVAAALENALFLEGPRFQDYQAQAARDFHAAPARPASSAGSAYPEDPQELARELDRMLAQAPHPEEALPGPQNSRRHGKRPRGIVVPHIDYLRGGAGYGQAYSLLRRFPAPKTVVVLGTAHTPLQETFSLCEKDFETPLGTVPFDRDLGRRIRDRLGPGADQDLLAHRSEHSVELQAVWLRHIYGDGVRIVPVLAASLGEYIEGDKEPDAAPLVPAMARLAAILRDAADSDTEDVLLMASADLSHIGPRFGDRREISTAFLAEVEEADRDYLEAVAESPVSGLESLAAHRDRYHVCGSACIFALGLALEGADARLLGYHQAVTPEMQQAVTFAAMAME